MGKVIYACTIHDHRAKVEGFKSIGYEQSMWVKKDGD